MIKWVFDKIIIRANKRIVLCIVHLHFLAIQLWRKYCRLDLGRIYKRMVSWPLTDHFFLIDCLTASNYWFGQKIADLPIKKQSLKLAWIKLNWYNQENEVVSESHNLKGSVKPLSTVSCPILAHSCIKLLQKSNLSSWRAVCSCWRRVKEWSITASHSSCRALRIAGILVALGGFGFATVGTARGK